METEVFFYKKKMNNLQTHRPCCHTYRGLAPSKFSTCIDDHGLATRNHLLTRMNNLLNVEKTTTLFCFSLQNTYLRF